MIRLGTVTVDRTVSIVALTFAYAVVGCSADATDGPNGSGTNTGGGVGLPPGGGGSGTPVPGAGGATPPSDRAVP